MFIEFKAFLALLILHQFTVESMVLKWVVETKKLMKMKKPQQVCRQCHIDQQEIAQTGVKVRVENTTNIQVLVIWGFDLLVMLKICGF